MNVGATTYVSLVIQVDLGLLYDKVKDLNLLYDKVKFVLNEFYGGENLDYIFFDIR